MYKLSLRLVNVVTYWKMNQMSLQFDRWVYCRSYFWQLQDGNWFSCCEFRFFWYGLERWRPLFAWSLCFIYNHPKQKPGASATNKLFYFCLVHAILQQIFWKKKISPFLFMFTYNSDDVVGPKRWKFSGLNVKVYHQKQTSCYQNDVAS